MKNRKQHLGRENLSFGVVLLVIGSVLLLDRMDIIDFSWVFSWPFILMGVGLFSMIRHGFRHSFGIIMFLAGAFFVAKREQFLPTEYYDYLLPAGIIFIGLYLILRKRSTFNSYKDESTDKLNSDVEQKGARVVEGDYIKAEAVFASVQRRLITKDFKGGKVSSVFGGADIDLSKAEIQDTAVLEVEVVFGGVKLIIPPNWEVQADVSNIFSGIEDKRAFPSLDVAERKTLIIRGSVSFGGLEFKSY